MSLPCNRLFIVAMVVFFPLLLHSQQNDFQLWFSNKANVSVFRNVKVHFEQELRLQENASQFGRQLNDLGLSYKINKHFKAGVFYRIEADWKNSDNYTWRNGLYGDVSATAEIRRFTLGYRLRVQSLKTAIRNGEESMFSGFRHRHKVTIEYNIKGIPLTPFIENEVFFNYTAAQGALLNGNRTWAGCDYKIKKRHTITLKYGIDKEWNVPNPLTSYIINLGYAIDLNLKNQSKE